MNLLLETDRLILRPWQESDVDHYMRLSKDIGYNSFCVPGQFFVENDEQAKAKISQRVNLFRERGLGKFPVFIREDGEFIGTCGLDPYLVDGNAEIELGYRLLLRQWSKGYATEAARAILRYGFEQLNLPRIIAFALPQNRASINVIERMEFDYLREFIHAGELHRLYEMKSPGKHE